MSAECDKHGCDLVYDDKWPDMVCQVCIVEAENVRYREALERIHEMAFIESWYPAQEVARAALKGGEG